MLLELLVFISMCNSGLYTVVHVTDVWIKRARIILSPHMVLFNSCLWHPLLKKYKFQTRFPHYFPTKLIIFILVSWLFLLLQVTWVEHVQVYEKYQVNHIFRDLLCDREAYGAKRWIVTLQRMCERFNFQMGSTYPNRHDSKGGLILYSFLFTYYLLWNDM